MEQPCGRGGADPQGRQHYHSESHYGGTYFDTKTVTDYTYHYGQTFYGFIYTYQGSAKKKSKPKPKQYTAAKTAVTAPEEQEQVFRILEIDDSKAATQEIVQNDKLLQASAASHSTKKADTEKRAAAQKQPCKLRKSPLLHNT